MRPILHRDTGRLCPIGLEPPISGSIDPIEETTVTVLGLPNRELDARRQPQPLPGFDLMHHDLEGQPWNNDRERLGNRQRAWRSVDSQRLAAASIADREEHPRHPHYMVRVQMTQHDRRKPFETPARLPHRHLRSLATIEERHLAFAANQQRRQVAVDQRHHAPGAEQQCIDHSGSLQIT